MPVDAARRIRTARLRGSSEPLIRRGAVLLADALRTASLSETGRERVLLIRSLSLGVLRPDKSAASVALQLEQEIAECARHAVHGADPRAASAQAVFFHDQRDAVVALIQQLARGSSGDGGRAWFWRSAIPGWQPGATSVQAGRVLLGTLLNLGAGSHVLGQTFQRLVESSSLDVILCGVREQDGPVLLQRCGWRDSDRPADSLSAASAAPRSMPFPRAWLSRLLRWVREWGPSDARSLWLVAVAVQSWHPEREGHRDVLREARALLRMIVSGINASFVTPQPDDDFRVRISEEACAAGYACEPEVSEESHPLEGVPVYTSYAGFWFLIPLLVRAGFSRAVQDHPEWVDNQIPRRLLRSLAYRLSTPPDDPVCLWLSDDEAGGSEGVERNMEASSEDEGIVAAWRMSMRRWCRVQARLGLVNLIRRPGWVSLSKTHLEVWMPLSEVDLRVRRAGLDIDPGWVPWLGQVIRFHYDAERRSHGTGGIAGR